ncbi:unnamed protein product [Durusdinium trenchii]|uniref:VPS9 domain-containing protein n=1 Tax=Durusdinium trenchii TaxID=1381693 RepID=A0ABP0RJ48_9DINO
MAVALVQCEGAAGSVMEEVLKAEMEVLHSDQPLEEGSFMFAFLLGLSANDPDCEAWVAEAISEKTLDALRQLLSPDRARRAKSLRKFSRAFVQPEISKTRSQDQLPVPSVADFIGEPEEALPQLSPVPSPRSTTPAVAFALPAGKEVELADHSDSPKRQEWAMRRANITNSTGSVLDLDGIAATLVQSLAEAAYAAPPTLCRLAAALRTFGDKGQDLLGRLLFVHWLVPALLKPALGLGLGLAEVFPVLTAAETTYSLRSLAQLLTAAVAHEAGDENDRSSLRKLFHSLAERGAAQAASKSEAELPCCVVCRTSELIALGSSLSAAAEEVAEILSMSADQVRLLGRRPSSPGSASAVVCWLKRCRSHEKQTDDITPKEKQQKPRLSYEERRKSLGTHTQEEALLLLRQLLSEPHQLCSHGIGQAGSALLAALEAARRGAELSRKLKIDLLQEALLWQEPSSSENAAPLTINEQELFNSLQEALEKERRGLAQQTLQLRSRRRLVRLSALRCREVTKCVRHCAKAAWTLRFNCCLQTLWTGSDRQSDLGMPELCVLGPETDPNKLDLDQELSPRQGRRRKRDGLFGIFSQEPEMEPRRESSVRMVKRNYCPYHRLAAVGASIGVEGLANDSSRSHSATRNLREILSALSKLRIDRARQERMGMTKVIQELVVMVSGIISNHCRLSQANAAHSQEEDEEWVRPHLLLQGSEAHATECVSRFIFHQLHHRFFPTEPTVDDQRIHAQIQRFSWLRPRHLDLPRPLVDTEQASEAILLLRKLRILRSPCEILEVIAKAFRITTQAACLKSKLAEGQSKSSQDNAFGADEALPLFILIIIRANPPMLHSVLSYAEHFTTSDQLRTEQGYALAQAQAAVSFSSSLRDKEQLSNLRPGEWESHLELGSGCEDWT